MTSYVSLQASDPAGATDRRTNAVRFVVLFLALAVLYLRIPDSFTTPQFWAEDNGFFYETRTRGWPSLFTPLAGYLLFIQFFVANLANYFSPVIAPAIFNYTAIFLTLVVVWMATSPRLDMPSKPLLAIAIVVVPMGFEELGTLTNIQWILPIGAFIMLFMTASPSRLVLAGEAVLLGITAFSGPFCLFLTPLFVWRLFAASDLQNRRRFLILTIVVGLGALAQILVIAAHSGEAISPGTTVPYSWTLWINLPFTQIMTTFGPASRLFRDGHGFVLGSLLLVTAVALACIGRYRTQKLFMLVLALAIAFSGMYKFRSALEAQSGAQRYFYVAAVFSLWFICCLTAAKYWRLAAAALVAMTEIALLPVVAHTSRVVQDQEWPVWTRFVSSGLPVIVPSTPGGFYVGFAASSDGPLSKFRGWLGRDITDLAGEVDPAHCTGDLGRIAPLTILNLQAPGDMRNPQPGWVTSGSAWDAAHDKPVQLVALVDQNNKVTGFGFPGFQQPASKVPSAKAAGWHAIFYAVPGTSVHAFGILDSGRHLCPLDNERGVSAVKREFASQELLGASYLVPGKDLAQRFKPAARLEGISARFVNFGHQPNSYPISWRVTGQRGGQTFELGTGTIDAGAIGDWQLVDLALSNVPKDVPDEIVVSFKTDLNVAPALPVGMPFYRPLPAAPIPPLEIGGIPAADGGQLSLLLSYAQ